MFIIYTTAVIALSLVVYIFFLKNKGPNWLDGTRTH
jgi:MHS family alpha-ketoglutarate permease-like MFS transporter